MLRRHHRACRFARAVQISLRHPVLVRRQLQHRVLGGVQDQRTGAQVLGAEVIDRRHAVVGAVADHVAPDRSRELLDHLLREALGIRR
jgi:hypothetical protein